MYSGRKYRFDWTFSLRVGVFVAVAASFPLAFGLWWLIGLATYSPADNRITFLNCIFYGGVILYFLNRFGLYQWKAFVSMRTFARRLPMAIFASLITFGAIRFLVADQLRSTYLPFIFFHLLIAALSIAITRIIVRTIDSRMVQGITVERIAVIGWSDRIARVLASLQREMGEYQQTLGVFHESEEDRAAAEKAGLQSLGQISDFEKVAQDQDVTFVITEQGKVRWKELRDVIAICADEMISLRLIPSAFDIWAKRLSVRVLNGIPLMGINDLHHDRYLNRVLKRALDIVCATAGLIASAPIIGVLAILIKRESPGPVFYRQTRLGLHDKPFQIIKLRSMRVDAEQETGAVWAVGDDPRRLRIGAFMRSWNLDELPQFWNVLKGDMSMVGPRPERPEFVEDFRDTVRYYNLRHSCKPGVTGWAAVHGLRGNTSLEDRLDYDLYYIENWSLLLDVRIMLMTLAPPKNAY